MIQSDSLEAVIQEMLENREGYYVLIGTPDMVERGEALFFNTWSGTVSFINGDDQLHRDMVRRMQNAGARQLARIPPGP